jgi:hypothetical protein
MGSAPRPTRKRSSVNPLLAEAPLSMKFFLYLRRALEGLAKYVRGPLAFLLGCLFKVIVSLLRSERLRKTTSLMEDLSQVQSSVRGHRILDAFGREVQNNFGAIIRNTHKFGDFYHLAILHAASMKRNGRFAPVLAGGNA